MIIAVDGPAGAGKSTVSKLLAQRIGFTYLDTGAMYRALTLKALESGLDITDNEKLAAMARATNIDLKMMPEGGIRVLLDSKDVTQEIRSPRITKLVSDVAKVRGVREVMVSLQRRLGSSCDSILDGRDIGTAVFPDAERKFYIDADFNERVRRRYKELKEAGQEVTPEAVAADLKNRDTIDSTRDCNPLKKAEDAIYIDTTGLTIEEVVEELARHIRLPSGQK